MPLASRTSRLLGQFLDGLFGLVLFIPAAFFFAVDEDLGAVAMVIALFVYLLYLLFADAMPGGQSFGKRATGIAVVDHRTYAPCSAGQSFVRNLMLAILGFFDWVFILGDSKRRLGDHLAGTIVVQANAAFNPTHYAQPHQPPPAWPA